MCAVVFAPTTAAATTGTLTRQDQDRARYTDLHMIPMDPGSASAGARLLEVFFDQVVWAA
jgi:hypothetical protein